MRLKSVWISEYKNLRDFTLAFDGESFLDIFVGKNGTGKSNFFEALVEIFRHIFDSRAEQDEIAFSYEVTYEMDGEDTTIRFENETFKINGTDRKTIGRAPVPDNVLIYYSGHNPTINRTVMRYERRFADQSRSWQADAARRFIGIRSDYKELLLTVLLMQEENCMARKYLCEKLQIDVVPRQAFTLTLKRPSFASRVQVDVGDAATFLWGAAGTVRDFLDRLTDCIEGGFTFGSIYDREADQYTIPIDIERFRARFENVTASELFRRFDQLKAIDMFAGLSVPLRLKSGDVARVGDFSDGQFQSVYIFAISELFKDRNCITLLDEPDSFLHPEWQFGFLQQVVDIAGTQATQTNHVLLSSHSASTIAQTEEPQIRMFEIGDDGVQVSATDKSTIVRSLSAGLIVFSEREARLNIYHNLKNTSGHVLMVEGVSDEIILETAWRKLNGADAERNFDIISAFACSTLGRLMRDNDFYAKHPNRTIFALFDWDKAFNEWNDGGSDLIEGDPAKCLAKKRRNKPGYNIMLPVPATLSCRNQVVDPTTGAHFGSNASLPIELLFIDAPGTADYFAVDHERPGGCMKFQGNKVAFAKEVVPNLPAASFEIFRPVFDFIGSKT